jgi:hypothetical protein
MSPFKIGDRVVVQHPADGWRVMTVLDIGGDLSVSDGERWGLVPASEVRPAMPRDRHDLERWGPWWWLGDRPVRVIRDDDGWIVWRDEPRRAWSVVAPSDPMWRGPVARPPEVRS